MKKDIETYNAFIVVSCETHRGLIYPYMPLEQMAPSGVAIQLHGPEDTVELRLKRAACGEERALYAHSILKCRKMLMKATNKRVAILNAHVPSRIKLLERISQAEAIVVNGGRRSNGKKADAIEIWTELLTEIQKGRIQITEVEEDAEVSSTFKLLELAAKQVALISKRTECDQTRDLGTVFDEDERAKVKPPSLPVTPRKWVKRNLLIKPKLPDVE